MGQRYPYAKIGRPVERVKAEWTVLAKGRVGKYNYGLIQRIRTGTGISNPDVSYAVVRSDQPILSNGTKLRPMEAVPFRLKGFRNQRPCKASHLEAWHSSLSKALSKYRSFVP